MKIYDYSPETAFNEITAQWKEWETASGLAGSRYVVGISGGVDSSLTAALAVEIFGKDRVLGVLLPNGVQKDIDAARRLCSILGIPSMEIDIGEAFSSIIRKISHAAPDFVSVSDDTKINLPARLRMSTLYAVAQSCGGVVLNTSNLSESMLNYDTIFGDDCGAYAPIQELTKTEIVALAEWIGLPDDLSRKPPADGLQPWTDEDRLGVKYADVDRFIRFNEGSDELKTKVFKRYMSGKFKLDTVRLRGTKFNWPNFVELYGLRK